MATKTTKKTVTLPIKTETYEAPVLPKSRFRFNKQVTIALLAVIVIAILFLKKDLFVVALVNNKPVSRLELIKGIEKKNGKAALENVITEMLIYQEAGKQNVKIQPQEIDDKIKEIEKQFETQGQKLDDLLAAQGETRQSVRKQIELQMIIEKVLGKDITVSDEEISTYFKASPDQFPAGTKIEDKKEEIRSFLVQQALGTKVQTWIQELHTKAKIIYLKQY